MLIPTRYENLNTNSLVIGADILKYLKKKPYTIENLYQRTNELKNITLDIFLDTVLFLWLSELIELKDNQIYCK